jgi:hypothetical protein
MSLADDAKPHITAMSNAERQALRDDLQAQIDTVMREVQGMAHNLAGQTEGYVRAWEMVIEKRRQQVDELQRLRDSV